MVNDFIEWVSFICSTLSFRPVFRLRILKLVRFTDKDILFKIFLRKFNFLGIIIVLNVGFMFFFFVKLIEVTLQNVNKLRISRDFLRIGGKLVKSKGESLRTFLNDLYQCEGIRDSSLFHLFGRLFMKK